MSDKLFPAKDAQKLDAPERKTWLPPAQVLDLLDLHPGMVVADIGAGSGYFTLPIAESPVGVQHVFAVDLQPAMLSILEGRLPAPLAQKVSLVAGRADATGLSSATCDLVLLANIWHEVDDRPAVLKECRRILRTGGRVAILDWRDDVPQPPGPPLEHRLSQASVAAELARELWKIDRQGPVGTYSYLLLAR